MSAEGFSRNVGYSNMAAWADVPAGTRGELDVTGPVSYRCPGTFQTPPASWRAEYPYLQPSARDPNWPSLHFRDSLGGSTFTLRVFSPSGSVSTTLPRGSASPVPTTTEFHPGPPPPGCDQTGGPPPAPPESAVAVFPKLRSEVSAISNAKLRQDLQAKVEAAQEQVRTGAWATAANTLQDLMDEAYAQEGKNLTPKEEDAIVVTAHELFSDLSP